jgi:hypothetical protein
VPTKLTFLTLNTDHTAIFGRESVDQRVIDQLLPIIDAEGGPIPGLPGWYLDFLYPLDPAGTRQDGSAFFQISQEPKSPTAPMTMGLVCWKEEHAQPAWDALVNCYRTMEEALKKTKLWREPAPSPPPVPWLVVYLTPFVVLSPPDAKTIMVFGDLGKCIAWALIHDLPCMEDKTSTASPAAGAEPTKPGYPLSPH